ncbi:peptidoglycan DD-metalloendopeptidase family protein [Algiphilus sp.]|uniref:peptidoglycan DD-metalloendopeptidase family protein n=2 Tax=Algiphilus sp. TaxID=1872431 RepID=UPI0025BE4B80|nr:peptidoglycan DD-metalloendopeptidase family protein [Algiphilus sp.]MCK5770866.1 peptidoglycan DD-metalloendopeptidase family protein [Algiphilus sp.]
MRATAAGLLIALVLTGCASALRWEAGTGDGEYRVRRGDTLYSIALRHDVDYRSLARWNDIGPNYLIHVGDVLRLTPPGGAAARPGSGTVASAPPTRAPSAGGGSGGAAPERELPSRSPPVGPGPDQWRWPVAGDVARRFAPPDSKGIDIAAPVGTPVRAAAAGRVVYSGSALKGYGELVIVKHDETYLTAYGYNRRRLAEEGDRVSAGDAIAEVGVGPAQKPVLHFEIRRAGKPVDPLRLLPASE